jgi:DNA-directed RNA polymerase specialized sigma24 family protein
MHAGSDDVSAERVRPALAETAARLLRAVATGDRAAFAELFDRFGGLFSASIATVHADASTRDRLCTEAFAAVWRRAREGARAPEPVLWLLEVLCETLGSSREGSRRPLAEGLLALACPDRELLLLAVAGRYSQPEIAALTGVRESRLRAVLRDALGSLRGGLGDGRLTA